MRLGLLTLSGGRRQGRPLVLLLLQVGCKLWALRLLRRRRLLLGRRRHGLNTLLLGRRRWLETLLPGCRRRLHTLLLGCRRRRSLPGLRMLLLWALCGGHLRWWLLLWLLLRWGHAWGLHGRARLQLLQSLFCGLQSLLCGAKLLSHCAQLRLHGGEIFHERYAARN